MTRGWQEVAQPLFLFKVCLSRICAAFFNGKSAHAIFKNHSRILQIQVKSWPFCKECWNRARYRLYVGNISDRLFQKIQYVLAICLLVNTAKCPAEFSVTAFPVMFFLLKSMVD
jgi:hypothetical protein